MDSLNATLPPGIDIQREILLSEGRKCTTDLYSDQYDVFNRTFELFCDHIWDGISCWPPTLAGTTAKAPCPEYFHHFNPSEYAYRTCTTEGLWWTKPDGKTWTDYSACKFPKCPSKDVTDYEEKKHRLMETMYRYLAILSIIGNTCSLVSLISAIFILATCRRLYCPRNTLHINLFVAFTIHAFATIIARGTGYELAGYEGVHSPQNGTVFVDNTQSELSCRFSTAFFHYAIMSNYFWIFIEGLYLNNVISFSVFTDHSKIWMHMVCGWITPIFFVALWASLRLRYQDYDDAFQKFCGNLPDRCWKIHEVFNQKLFWILRGPITFTICMNFLFFVNITRLIFIKFTAQTSLREQQSITSGRLKYRKLAKSTLVLLAVYGIHFFFILLIKELNNNMYLDMIILMIDLAVTSFQGLLASALLCFANGEVRNEIRRIASLYLPYFVSVERAGSNQTSRVRRISEPEKSAEAIKMKPRTVNIYCQLAANNKGKLQVPSNNTQPASCESLVLHTADNSDDDRDA